MYVDSEAVYVRRVKEKRPPQSDRRREKVSLTKKISLHVSIELIKRYPGMLSNWRLCM
jgi:hypothetical protein